MIILFLCFVVPDNIGKSEDSSVPHSDIRKLYEWREQNAWTGRWIWSGNPCKAQRCQEQGQLCYFIALHCSTVHEGKEGIVKHIGWGIHYLRKKRY